MKNTDSQRTNINLCELGSVDPITMNSHSITVESKTVVAKKYFFTSQVGVKLSPGFPLDLGNLEK